MINITTNTNSTAPPPHPVVRPRSSDTSPLTAILCLVALITIPMILYAFFVALMKCPRNPFRRPPATARAEVSCKADRLELVCGVKYRKSAEDGRKEAAESSDQCPVCLSAFAEGEEIRQLSACKHAFHAACVDMWLYSHSNCPVCRAAVPVRRSKRVSIQREDDFQQGLPDAANLI